MYQKSKTKKYKRSNNRNLLKSRKSYKRKSYKRKSYKKKSYKRKTLKSRSRFGGVSDHWSKVFKNIAETKRIERTELLRKQEAAKLAEELRKIDEATRKEEFRQSRIADALDGECTICLESMDKDKDKNAIEKCLSCLEEKDIPSQLPCDHFFHGKCIKNWKKQRNECPLCRLPITSRQSSDDYLNYY
jgi:hypothetical protein